MPAAVPKPAPALAPDRQQLAAAIDRLNVATQYRDRVRQAQADAAEAAYPLRLAVDQAAVALQTAEDAAPRLRLAALLGNEVTEVTPQAAQAALAEARAALAAVNEDRDLIATELARAETAVDYATRNRDSLVADIIKSAPGGDRLIADLRQACARARDILATLKLIRRDSPMDCVIEPFAPSHDLVPGWATPLAEWAAAIQSLHDDAGTIMPGDIDDDPPPLEAA